MLVRMYAKGDVTQVADGVFLATGTDVNWVLLADGAELTLVDGGYPGDLPLVERSVAAIGYRPQDVRAILLTHAHTDHMGALGAFHRRYRTPLLVHPAELAHARREYLQQLTPARLARHLWRPATLAWAVRILRAGAAREVAAAHARAFDSSGPLDLPGRPVPVATPGHTDGHVAYHLPGVGAVVTGDALVTGHPTSGRDGPQQIPRMFTHDPDTAAESLTVLAGLAADLVLPGHGPAWHGPVGEAARLAAAPYRR